MTEEELTSLKYPAGKFLKPKKLSPHEMDSLIEVIGEFPAKLKKLTSGLWPVEKSFRYRPEGWSIKQVVHHCADSHANSFVRFKLALTEENPIIKPYFEDRWAEMPDALDDDILSSLNILEGLHHRWVILLSHMQGKDWQRSFVHPEHGTTMSLGEALAMYAWHCRHHLAHIKQALESQGQYN